MTEEETKKAAYLYAVNLLSYRLRSEFELIKKLKLKGYSEDVVLELIQELKAQNFINDERLAENLLLNLIKYKHYGFYKAKTKLFAMGFSSKLIEQKLAEVYTPEIENQVIQSVLKKTKMPPQRGEQIAMQKIAAKLQARGFRFHAIRKAVFK